jgi:hypothetical protein
MFALSNPFDPLLRNERMGHSMQQLTLAFYGFLSARFKTASRPVLISVYSCRDNVPLSFSLSMANNSSLRMLSNAALLPVAAGFGAGA